MEDKVDLYMAKITEGQKKMLNPTGRQPVFPSQVMARTELKGSTPLPISLEEPNPTNETHLEEEAYPLDLGSTHLHHGSWSLNDAVRDCCTDKLSSTCKVNVL